MICKECGRNNKDEAEKCEYCGAEIVKDPVKRYTSNVRINNEFGEYKRKNPMLQQFFIASGFFAVLLLVVVVLFCVEMNDFIGWVYRISFLLLDLLVGFAAIFFYLKPAFELDKLFRGKGVKAKWELQRSDLVELAETAKKKYNGFYRAIIVFAAALAIYSAFQIVSREASENTIISIIALIFSLCIVVFFVCVLIFFPNMEQKRIYENGKEVIIGEKSVFANGYYYHWLKINPQLTSGKLNRRRRILQLEFIQEYVLFGKSRSKKRSVSVFVPDESLDEAEKLVDGYIAAIKKYKKIAEIEEEYQEKIKMKEQEK